MFSSASDSSTEDDDGAATGLQEDRGRRSSQADFKQKETLKRRIAPLKRQDSLQNNHSSSGISGYSSPSLMPRGPPSFTRSRSPAIVDNTNGIMPLSPSSILTRYRHTLNSRGTLPANLQLLICFPFTCTGLLFHVDSRKAGESLLLLGSLIYASQKLSGNIGDPTRPDVWISIGAISSCCAFDFCSLRFLELYILVIASLLYTLWTHTSLYNPLLPPSSAAPSQRHRASSQRPAEGRDGRRNGPMTGSIIKKDHFSYVWMTVPKNYR